MSTLQGFWPSSMLLNWSAFSLVAGVAHLADAVDALVGVDADDRVVVVAAHHRHAHVGDLEFGRAGPAAHGVFDSAQLRIFSRHVASLVPIFTTKERRNEEFMLHHPDSKENSSRSSRFVIFVSFATLCSKCRPEPMARTLRPMLQAQSLTHRRSVCPADAPIGSCQLPATGPERSGPPCPRNDSQPVSGMFASVRSWERLSQWRCAGWPYQARPQHMAASSEVHFPLWDPGLPGKYRTA